MASATARPQKKLGDFLKEQQEPFVLEVYLSERGYSKKWSSTQDQDGGSGYSFGDSGKSLERSASSASNKKRKALLPFSKVLTAVCKKLSFPNESRDEGTSVPESSGRVDQTVVETDRFSSASSSTVFNSCSEIDDEEETWISSHKDHPTLLSQSHTHPAPNVQSQQATDNGKNCRRCIEDSPAFLGKIPAGGVQISQNSKKVNEDVWRMEQRIPSCGVFLPKKITEDSIFSAALWGLLIQSDKKEGCSMELREILGPNVSQIMKSNRAMQKTKQLLFDCVREITVTLPRKNDGHQGYKQLWGAEELGKLICDKTKEWGQQAGDKTNLTYLLTSDYFNSIKEWSGFQSHMKEISFEIADAILECINNEIVSEIIEILAPTI